LPNYRPVPDLPRCDWQWDGLAAARARPAGERRAAALTRRPDYGARRGRTRSGSTMAVSWRGAWQPSPQKKQHGPRAAGAVLENACHYNLDGAVSKALRHSEPLGHRRDGA